jgi:Kinesin motor domain
LGFFPQGALNGVGGVVLAYGQTGSGKTYVSCGASGEGQRTAGIISLAVQDLLESIAQENDPLSTKICYSMYEVYMESVTDLVTKKEGLHLFDTKDGLVIPGKVFGQTQYIKIGSK